MPMMTLRFTEKELRDILQDAINKKFGNLGAVCNVFFIPQSDDRHGTTYINAEVSIDPSIRPPQEMPGR